MNLTEAKIEFYSGAVSQLHEALVFESLNRLADAGLELSEADVALVSAFHESVIDEALERGALDSFVADETELLESLSIVNDSVYVMTESKDLMYVDELPVTEGQESGETGEFGGVHESANENAGFEGEKDFQESSQPDNIDDLVENLIESLNI
jgi:hypothetical protein